MKASQLRRAALLFPEAEEVETWGEATFRVRGKIFCILGRESANLKATKEQQAELVASRPDAYAVAPYTGRFGWVSVQLARVEADEVAELLEDAWRQSAPKRVVKAFDHGEAV